MRQVPCHRCGRPHDLSELEPSFRRPDAFLEVPPEERPLRTLEGDDACMVRDAADTVRRYFLRVLLPVPVDGAAEPCCWGIWAEVSEGACARAFELWKDPASAAEPPFPGRLANAVPDYPATVGLPGQLQLNAPPTIPTFRFDPDVKHPLAEEQRHGVPPERVLDWLLPWLHPES